MGVVVAKDGNLLEKGHRGELSGGEHAEYTVIERKLGNQIIAGATVYTTLEPCTTRKHPKIPCAERLVERKVSRVVIGMLDPNPDIRGKGQLRLRDANITTDLFPSDLMAQVEEINREFLRCHREAGSIGNRAAPSPADEGVVYLVGISFADQLADMKREEKAEKFRLVQDDRGIREYSRREIDTLTTTQRAKLFAADPEMEAWWRGKSPASATWPLFRVKGGIWLAKQQINQTPTEHHSALFEGIAGLFDWYLKDRES